MNVRHIGIGVGSLLLSRGGTERAAVRLAEAMIERGHRVTLFYLPHPRNLSAPVYSLPAACAVVRGPTQQHCDIRNMREILRASKMDVFLSMESSALHLLWAVSVLGTGIPFICSERHHPLHIEKHFWNRAGRLAVLSGADFIHELFPEYLNYVPEIWNGRVRVIGNSAPADPVTQAHLGGAEGERKILLYLARFKAPKRPDLLIKAFSLLKEEFPDWQLHLWGHGLQEQSLRALIKELKLNRQARIMGEARDVMPIYAKAHLYCLASEEEGFPNSLLEAMSAGLPCVAFSGCAGARALLENDKNGALAAEMTPNSLATSLRPLMASANMRAAMGKAAKQRAAEYSPERIYSQWEALLDEAAERKGHTVMDEFQKDPFACRSTLSAAARREWIFRDFGQPMPHSLAWMRERLKKTYDSTVPAIKKTVTNALCLISLVPKILRAPHSRTFSYNKYIFQQIQRSVAMLKEGHNPERTKDFISYICKHIAVKDLRVLCVGCRNKKELELWKATGAHTVVGIDLFAEDGDILVMDMHHMTFKDNSFDLIYSCHSFEHSLHPEKAAKEFLRVARNGGYVAIEVPTNFQTDNIDIHDFKKTEQLRSLFGGHISSVIVEEFIKHNSKHVDVHRLIYKTT